MRQLKGIAGWGRCTALVLAACCGTANAGQGSPFVDAISKPTIVIRPVQPLPDTTVDTIAKLGASQELSPAQYPFAQNLSARRIVEGLCGSYRESYWSATRNLNQLGSRSPDAVLGKAVYQIKWPACAFLQYGSEGWRYIVKPGDTAADIYRKFTGSRGDADTIRHFFRASGVDDVAQLRPGQELRAPYLTLATKIPLETDHQSFVNALAASVSSASTNYFNTQLAAGGNDASGPSRAPASLPAAPPQLVIAAGHIQQAGLAGPGGNTYEPPSECKVSGSTAPFDAARVSYAYAYARGRLKQLHLDHSPVHVFVADNGFFGARLAAHGLVFGNNFPDRFFSPALWGDGQVGPLSKDGQGHVIYPINYSNGLTKPTIISGHGTHVTGLVLGGPTFQRFLNVFDRGLDGPWLHLTIFNIGDGNDYLLTDSEEELRKELVLGPNRAIVNLSLEYSDDANQMLKGVFQDILRSTPNNLYVVAAGNDGSDDVAAVPYYPAAYGGPNGMSNVVTVAAARSDQTIAAFSNRGADATDLAALGCNLSSWLDASTQTVSVSGTSQAAAVVTFAASLLESLGGFQPQRIKNRLMVSGDLLRQTSFKEANGTIGTTPDPAEIYARTALNIPKALYLFDDYVRYRDAKNGVHELLGTLTAIQGVSCAAKPPTADQGADLWALKAEGKNWWAFRGRKAGRMQRPCRGTAASGAALYIVPAFTIAADGKAIPINGGRAGQALDIPLPKLEEFVAAIPTLNSP